MAKPSAIGPLPSLLRIFETSLTVRDLAATHLSYVEPNWTARDAVSRMQSKGYDVAPLIAGSPMTAAGLCSDLRSTLESPLTEAVTSAPFQDGQ